ncbi:MAG: sulfite exporter TauE/SafE family protein [Halobacteriaceae archaeon]
MAGLAPGTALLLAAVAFGAGIGITAVGPGGVLLTVALVALTDLAPGAVVGTAMATFVATGLLGSAAYARSGDLRERRGLAASLSATGLAGALAGVALNGAVSERGFELLLGAFVVLTGALVWYRTRAGAAVREPARPLVAGALVGGGVGLSGGLLGVGGPVLAVPLLVVAGVPMLPALAVAQVQSVFVAAAATGGYLLRGTVSPALVALVGVPELGGVVVGWLIAHRVDERRLTRVLAALLVALGPYLAL